MARFLELVGNMLLEPPWIAKSQGQQHLSVKGEEQFNPLPVLTITKTWSRQMLPNIVINNSNNFVSLEIIAVNSHSFVSTCNYTQTFGVISLLPLKLDDCLGKKRAFTNIRGMPLIQHTNLHLVPVSVEEKRLNILSWYITLLIKYHVFRSQSFPCFAPWRILFTFRSNLKLHPQRNFFISSPAKWTVYKCWLSLCKK